jgi:hypothetical protein
VEVTLLVALSALESQPPAQRSRLLVQVSHTHVVVDVEDVLVHSSDWCTLACVFVCSFMCVLFY